MLILLLGTVKSANFHSPVCFPSQANHSSQVLKSSEDIVPKRDKGFPFSSYLLKSLFSSEAPGVIVVLKALPLSL